MKKLVVATRNKDKLREIKSLLKNLPVKVYSVADFENVPEVIESGKTLESNAKKKAQEVSRFLNMLAIADDSGLEVPALGNKPGVYSARFSGPGATYKSNNEKLLKILESKKPSDRKARFRCVMAVADKGRLIDTAEGICRGKITYKAAGNAGFGYDPVFKPHKHKKTFAQMSLKQKNKISHRSKALIKAKELVKRYMGA